MRAQGLPSRHPERRARSARSRRTSLHADARSGVEAPWLGCARVFRPVAPIVILSGGRGAPEVEGSHRMQKACGGVEAPWPGCARGFRPAAPARLESASDLRKSGSQGSMGRCAHRPYAPFFADQRVRLTKPPQVAAAGGPSPRRTCRPRVAGTTPRPAAIGAGFVRLASGRTRTRPAGARVGSAPDLQAPAGAQARRPPRPADCRPRLGRLVVKTGVRCRRRKCED